MKPNFTTITAPVRIDVSGGWPDSDPYRKDFGGSVLNAAINLRVSAVFDKIAKTGLNKVLPQSGLGTSGAIRAVELAVSNLDLLQNKIDLIRKVHHFENNVIGHRAGFQDEAAAIFGGMNYWEFDRHDNIVRKPVLKEKAHHFEQRTVIVYTGESHLSANIHDLVFNGINYRRNIPKLDRMKEISVIMTKNIDDQQIMSELINETWDLQKSLHYSIETDIMRSLQTKLTGTYLATRAVGAGGGGCMIFYTHDKPRLLAVLKKTDLAGVKHIPYKFDYHGIRIEK
jgi:D-glycero-alpha-D-manno-heptose-7-phosphate kinase